MASGTADFAPAGHDIEFDHVAFSYGAGDDGRAGERVLADVSFTAREGQVTALVGPSGSGKSTCARLAARFWDATGGTVCVGGVDVSTVDPETLLRDYAIVFQDVLLFDDTVMGNIRLGRRDATDAEVLAAARAANCDEFVSRMPQGYDTKIGENGSKLSGRRAPANLDCPRAVEERAHRAARRGDGIARRGERNQGAICSFKAASRQNGHRDRAPHAHGGSRRQSGGSQSTAKSPSRLIARAAESSRRRIRPNGRPCKGKPKPGSCNP